MEFFIIMLALALPACLGAAWLGLHVPGNAAARAPLVWGNGTLLGLVAVPLLMRGLNALGLPLDFNTTAAVCAALILLAVVRRSTGLSPLSDGAVTASSRALSTGERLLCGVLLALVVLRVGSLGLEIWWRPLFPWDATMHWATKARVWFEYRDMLPFVGHHEWLVTGGEGVFTDRHPHYPPMIPLLQVWMNLALGSWNESLMNLPWLACFAALGAAFYAQLRGAGVAATVAAAFTYMLMSMPLINTHVALAGYADLFLGATYCCALMALHNWMRTRGTWQAVLAVAFALACPLVKSEGVIWASTLLPAAAVAYGSRGEALKLIILLGLWGIFAVLVVPEDVRILSYTIHDFAPAFNPEALTGLLRSTWQHDNWHLFGYMALAIIPLGIAVPGAMTRRLPGLTVALACAVGAFLYLFLFTGFAWGASNLSAVGRLSVHLVPGLLFLSALLFNELLQRQASRAAPR